MRRVLYEEFKRNLPSPEITARHRTEIHEANKAKFARQVAYMKELRERRAPYEKALVEFLSKDEVFRHLPSASKADPTAAKKRFAQLKKPNPLRLKHRIWKQGSLYLNDVPSANAPFIGWIDDSVAGLSPNNDAEGWGSYDNVDTVSMGISAGEGLNGNPQSGGSAACWGYVGEYFTPSDPCPEIEILESQLQFSANPSIYCDPNWTTTFNPFFPLTDYAKLTIQVNLMCMVYDTDWNYLNTVTSPPYNIITPVDQFTGSDDYGGVGFDLNPQLGPLTVPVSLSNNYGFFVQFYMFASGNGESTGSWVPGSNADASLSATVPSLQFEAIWNT